MTVNIALTSYPKRIGNCARVIETILGNTVLPDRIYLTLSHLEFPHYERDLPADLYKLVMTSNRVILNWVEENRKSFKKVFPILPYLEDDDVVITVDDDTLIPQDFVESRMADFKFSGCDFPISSNLSKTINIDSLVVSCYSLFQKRMLKGYDRLLCDAVYNTCNDDRTYLYLCYLNGFKVLPCTKYCVGKSNGKVKVLETAPHGNYKYVAGAAYDKAVESAFSRLSGGKKIGECFNLFNIQKEEPRDIDEYQNMVRTWMDKSKDFSFKESQLTVRNDNPFSNDIDDFAKKLFEFGKGDSVKHDLVYVLGSGSKHGNLEIKISITSVLKFCSHWIGDIYIVGENPGIHNPKVKHIYAPDITRGNKDGNIIHKLLTAIQKIPGLTDNFLFCSDDILVTKRTDWDDFVPRCIFEYRQDQKSRDKLMEQSKKNPWDVLMLKTLDRFVGNRNHIYFYEPHIFAPVNKKMFKKMCKEIDYMNNRNVIIMSLWFNWLGLNKVPRRFDHQSVFNDNPPEITNKYRHITYNDKAFGVKRFRDRLISLVTN